MTLIAEKAYPDRALIASDVRDVVSRAVVDLGLTGKRVLVIIPDGTRTAPIPHDARAPFLSKPATSPILLDVVKRLSTSRSLGAHAMSPVDPSPGFIKVETRAVRSLGEIAK